MMTEIKTPIKTLDNYDTLSLAESELPPYSAKASSSLRSREYRFHRGAWNMRTALPVRIAANIRVLQAMA